MTIAELHRYAYRRLPKAQCHEILHAWAAERFGVSSLKDCTPAQLRGLAALVNTYAAPAPDQGPATAKPARPRSGKPAKPGVTRMISARQIDFIHTLCSELGWTADTLRILCERELGLARCTSGPPWPAFDAREIGSSKAASKIINHLLGEKRRRAVAAGAHAGRKSRRTA